mgnify:CR=1 FL=1
MGAVAQASIGTSSASELPVPERGAQGCVPPCVALGLRDVSRPGLDLSEREQRRPRLRDASCSIICSDSSISSLSGLTDVPRRLDREPSAAGRCSEDMRFTAVKAPLRVLDDSQGEAPALPTCPSEAASETGAAAVSREVSLYSNPGAYWCSSP